MEQFTIEESMDAVLLVLDKQNRPDFGTLQSMVGNKHYRHSNLFDMLATMINDGHVKEEEPFGYEPHYHYSITNNGRIFLRDGGYVKKKAMETESYNNSVQALFISKQSLHWSKIAGITGIVATIIAVIAFIISLLSNQH